MTTLQSFQRAFAQALWTPDSVPSAITHLAAQPGFAVYRNTVISGCIDALQANYPAAVRVVGEEWFRAAAAVYVRAAPPDEPMLALYGRGFAEFLARFEPAAELPYLPAIARVDRLWTEAHAAADALPLDGAALLALTPADVARYTLRLHPATRWSWSDEFPVCTLWNRNRTPTLDATPFAWQAEGVLLTRPYGAVLQQPLTRGGAALLAACARRASIEQSVAAALSAEAADACDVGVLIGECVAAGAFCGIDVLPADGSCL